MALRSFVLPGGSPCVAASNDIDDFVVTDPFGQNGTINYPWGSSVEVDVADGTNTSVYLVGKIKAIVATDCGSTTTKAILIKLVDGEYRLIVRGEAPTTVDLAGRRRRWLEPQLEDLLGIKALNSIPVKTNKRGEGQLDLPVHFAGAQIVPGEYLYADPNGVIVAVRYLGVDF